MCLARGSPQPSPGLPDRWRSAGAEVVGSDPAQPVVQEAIEVKGQSDTTFGKYRVLAKGGDPSYAVTDPSRLFGSLPSMV